ncbi:MAG: LCP family protein [Actinomycetia bacterium]|nr:LCP family protein [Actinomycetes bacterium]
MSSAAPPQRSRRRRALTAVAVAAAVLVAAAGTGLFVAYRHLDANIETINVQDDLGSLRPSAPTTDPQQQYAPLNLLVMGSDARKGQGSGYGSAAVYSGARSDTTMLVHLSADRQRALVVAVPRDTIVDIPSCTTANGSSSPRTARFNEAFDIGGPACTIKTFEAATDIFVDHFVVVDFTGFKRMVDALGGVTVCVAEDVDDPQSGLVLSAGTHVVKGEQALAFVRARKSIGDGSDISRIDRQQAFMASLVSSAKSTSLLLDPVKLYRVLDAATQSLTTDPELGSLNALRQLAQSVTGIDPDDVTFVTVPWFANDDGATVSIKEDEAERLFAAVRGDQPWPPPPLPTASPSGPPLKTAPSDIRVTVVNATGTPGRAKEVAAELRELGFQIAGVDTADAVEAVTTVRYSPSRDESGRTLTASVKGAQSVVDDSLGRTLVLVVGTDYQGLLRVVVPGATSTPTASASATPRTADADVCS